MKTTILRTGRHWAMAALAATLAIAPIGCGQATNPDSTGAAQVSVQALSADALSSVTITVAGPALTAPRTEALFKTNGQWSGLLGGLPAADGYTFTANALATDGTRYDGAQSGVAIVAKQTTPVHIVASNLSQTFRNATPVIDSLTVSANKVAPGSVINVSVAAHDPDAGDTLTFNWSATGGTFADAAATQTTWTAPASEGNTDLTVVVQDSHGATSSTKVRVNVAVANGRGNANVSVTFSSVPVVSSVSANPAWLEKGVATNVVAQASDPDNDPLSYTWTTACAGSFAGNTATTSFTLAATEIATACTLTVSVADGTGNVTTGEVSVPVGKPAFNTAPEIVSTQQSATFVNAGDVVTLNVEATDADGDALVFAWTASAGTLSTATTGATTSQITWTAPDSGAPWLLTATVTDAKGAVTTQAFTVKMGLCSAPPASTSQVWKFGVMADTQWIGSDDGKNPNSVAVDIINALNSQFIAKGVDFVVQVGDLTDSGSTAALRTTAVFRQALYNAHIGFFPLRGNHESTALGATDFKTVFPQTQTGQMNATPSSAFTGAANADYPSLPTVAGTSFAMGSNFSTPGGTLAGLSYSFDYNNARFVLLDQFMKADGTSASGNYALAPQLSWVANTLSSKAADAHSFVFSHKGLITENHTDTLFGANPGVDGANQDIFINAMAASRTHYLMMGHDHMYDRSIIGTALSGTGMVQQIVCASDSSKFYIPYGPAYPASGNKTTNDDNFDVAAFGHKRQTQLAQELNTVGYYIVTVDGARVRVDFYTAPVNPTYSSGEYLMSTTPALNFTKRDTFGYSLNGKEFVVPSAGAYSVVSDSYAGSTLTMGGVNGSTATDSASRLLSKAVDTGWANGTCATASPVATVVGATSMSGVDSKLVAITFDPNRVSAEQIASGHFGLAVRDASGTWVNAATSGAPSFMLGPANAAAPLGTYGVDATSNTVWAIVDHDGDFAAATF